MAQPLLRALFVRTAHASRIPCALLLAVAGGLALAQCGGLRSASEDGTPHTRVDAGHTRPAPSSPNTFPSPNQLGSGADPCADPGCPNPPLRCTSSSDCGEGTVCLPPAPGVAFGTCVGCLSDSDCDYLPDFTVCDATHSCVQCRTSADCAANGRGPICAPDGSCTCATDADCAGRAGGPHCLGQNQGATKVCACQSPADCAQSRYGSACPTGAPCGCENDRDCPSSMNCVGQVACAPAAPQDAGTDAHGGPEAATGSVRCSYFVASPQGNSAGGGTGTGCNGTYRSDLGNYSITWTQPDGATMVCNASDQDIPANCPVGTPCTYRDPSLTLLGETDGSVVGTCQ